MENNDRRFQIFISSTFDDLQEERKQAVEVITDRGHIPIALENFSASNESDLEIIERVMGQCQIYILILGHRYGSIPPGNEISYTELEYQLAKKNELLILPFIMRADEVQRRRGTLDPKIPRDKAELDNFEKLQAFHDSIREYRQVWGRPSDNFKVKVTNAINDSLDKCKKPGFVRVAEEKVTNVVSVSENEFIYDIVEQLKNFKTLYDRCLAFPDKKQALANLFNERYLSTIKTRKLSLFFESGSTVTYVARTLADALREEVKIDENGSPNIHIATNNVLAYLTLWLKGKVPCTPFPWSPPLEKTYGAFYGGIQGMPEKKPDYNFPPLDEYAKVEIQKLRAAPFSLEWRQPMLLLGAASGLQITENHDLKMNDDLDPVSKNILREKLKKCFGPHVGSYRNKVFKRYMYATKLPILIFITGDKIDCEIDVGKCHFILDSEFTWEDFYKNHPVAFCVGCTQEKQTMYAELFRKLGFDIWYGPDASPVTALIARNNVFIETFEKQIHSSQGSVAMA